MLRGFITAFRTLTAVQLPGRDADDFASSLPWFPIVGLLLGGALWGCAVACAAWPEAAALAVVALGAILTRGLHLDGLADWADSLGILYDRKRALEVMKDPRTGSFAVVALILVILAKWVALVRLIGAGESMWLLAAVVISRTMQVETAVSQPYARAEGGTAAGFVANATWVHRAVALAAAAVILAGVFGPTGFAPLLFGWIICTAFSFWCRKRYGGVTGDLLGACSEIVETAILLTAAALVSYLPRIPGWEVLIP